MKELEYKLGSVVNVLDIPYLVVRVIENSSTLFEEPYTQEVFVDHETYVELRNAVGQAMFVTLSSRREPATKEVTDLCGIRPYFWKGVPTR
jgi:hypothetical protein